MSYPLRPNSKTSKKRAPLKEPRLKKPLTKEPDTKKHRIILNHNNCEYLPASIHKDTNWQNTDAEIMAIRMLIDNAAKVSAIIRSDHMMNLGLVPAGLTDAQLIAFSSRRINLLHLDPQAIKAQDYVLKVQKLLIRKINKLNRFAHIHKQQLQTFETLISNYLRQIKSALCIIDSTSTNRHHASNELARKQAEHQIHYVQTLTYKKISAAIDVATKAHSKSLQSESLEIPFFNGRYSLLHA